MKFNFNVLKTIELITSDKTLPQKSIKWYRSQEGITVYSSLTDISDKILHVYHALLALTNSNNHKVIYKGAVLLVAYVAETSLEYATYPNLIDPEKNPLIGAIIACAKCTDSDVLRMYHSIFLSQLHNDSPDAYAFVDPTQNPYTLIAHSGEGEISDLYKIERGIMELFGDRTDALTAPYSFDFGSIIAETSEEESDE